MTPQIDHLDAQATVGIRTQVEITEIGERIGELIPELMATAGPRAAGPIVARYHAWNGTGGEMEVAVPVSESVPGSGRVQAGELPAGRAVVVTHTGPYDGLKEAWETLGRWLKAQHLEGRAAPWEAYLSDCSQTPAEQLETRLVWPIQ